MLALSWNACVWAAAITVLTLRTAQGAGANKLSHIALAATALVPHLYPTVAPRSHERRAQTVTQFA